MKWESLEGGDWYGEGKHATYYVSGSAGEWWVDFRPKDSAEDVVWMSYNLGWAPKIDIAKRRCRDIEEWLNGRVRE
jgi:hypothetical protein